MSDSSKPFPSSGRIAGIDYGTVRIGIAVTNPTQTFASPLENYTRRGEVQDDAFFRQLVQDELLIGFVVGLPLHMSGDESQKSQEARRFGKRLATVTQCPVCFFDERYTTAFASEALMGAGMTKKQRKKRLDKLAAQIMLAAFLESSRRDDLDNSLE